MNGRITILALALSLGGCSGPTGPSATLAFKEDGSTMTNRFSLIAQCEVVRSHLILGKTVDVMNLATRWSTDRISAIRKLEDALQCSTDAEGGTVTIMLTRIQQSERAAIINTICDLLPRDHQVLNDPTPLPLAPDPKHPEEVPHSKNARIVRVQAEIVLRAR